MQLLREHHDAQAPPSPECVASARARLIAHTRPPRRRPRFTRPAMAGLGLAATAVAATAVAVAVAGSVTAPDPRPGDTDVSGRQVLLAAAHQAELAPTAGAYWHVKTYGDFAAGVGAGKTSGRVVTEIWVKRNGQAWVGWRRLAGARAGTADLVAVKRPRSFTVCDTQMTFTELVGLPPNATTLTDVIRKAMDHNDDGPVPAASQEAFVAGCLSQLLADVPATPKVRAAAYRALAMMPIVKVEGKATDPRGRAGVAVTIKRDSGSSRLIIDPRTSLVLSRQDTSIAKSRAEVYLATGWTDEKPHVPTA
ncbi:MAG TPA: CU044_5270 family protein [Streptosporangiaceae bacterium]